jgi:hypothetical protein
MGYKAFYSLTLIFRQFIVTNNYFVITLFKISGGGTSVGLVVTLKVNTERRILDTILY